MFNLTNDTFGTGNGEYYTTAYIGTIIHSIFTV
jgi:hypothetical protein